jgi:phospholipid N-methyltransferase
VNQQDSFSGAWAIACQNVRRKVHPNAGRTFKVGLDSTLLFARTFLKEPKMLGSLVPSSRFLTSRLLRLIDWNRSQVIVEFGPGIGNMTFEILQRLRADALLVCIEKNAQFVEHLRNSCEDSRLIVVQGSAEHVVRILAGLSIRSVDYILSGIPFSVMPDPVREAVLKESYSVLRPGGEMIVYQFSSAVLPHLKPLFERVEEGREPLNILPARIFRCIK